MYYDEVLRCWRPDHFVVDNRGNVQTPEEHRDQGRPDRDSDGELGK